MRLIHLALAYTAGLTCFAASSAAQGVVAWQFGYDFPGADTQKPTELVETPDGGALIIQTTSTRVIAVKFSKDGDRVWDFHQPNGVGPSGSHRNGSAHGAVDSAGNAYILAGNQPGTLFKLNPGGSLVWQRTLPDGPGSTFFYAAQVRVNSQDHVVVGGTDETGAGPVLRLMQFTPLGTILHDQASTPGLMRRMVLGPQDELAVFGQSDWDSGQFMGRVATFDPDGTPRWAQDIATDGEVGPSGPQFHERTEDGAIDDQGNVFAAVNGHFLRGTPVSQVRGFALAGFDSAGAQLLDLEVVGSAEAGVRQIAVDGNQGVYAAGWETDCVGAGPCDPRFSVWCASASGIAWQRRPSRALGIPGQAAAIHVASNGEAVASGFHLPGNARDGLDVAFDGNGTELWSVARQGTSALSDGVARYAVGQDRRGNLFTVGQLGESVHIRKYVSGGAVGNTICGHAPMNSAGHSALIRAGGSAAAGDDNVTLFVWTGTPNTYVMVLASQTRGLVPMLGGGQGTLCLGGTIGRFTGPRQLRRTSMQGLTSMQLDLPRIPEGPGFSAAAPGQTWYFQAWYRDANPVPTSNLTDAIRIVLQ